MKTKKIYLFEMCSLKIPFTTIKRCHNYLIKEYGNELEYDVVPYSTICREMNRQKLFGECWVLKSFNEVYQDYDERAKITLLYLNEEL